MNKIYIAGAYSADNVIDVLKNIGRGEKLAAEVFKLGFAPFCPWHDKTYVIDNPDFNFTVYMFYQSCIAWLKVSEGILLVPGWERSKGTLKEIEIAKQLNIPIFDDLKELENHAWI